MSAEVASICRVLRTIINRARLNGLTANDVQTLAHLPATPIAIERQVGATRQNRMAELLKDGFCWKDEDAVYHRTSKAEALFLSPQAAPAADEPKGVQFTITEPPATKRSASQFYGARSQRYAEPQEADRP
jgi:hypothetical protein